MPFALITRLLTGEAGILIARLKRVVAAYATMGLFAAIAAIFLVIAAFSWCASHIGTIATALIAAGVFLVLTLVAFVLARSAGRTPKQQDDERLRRDIASIAGVTALSNAPQIMRLVRQKRGFMILPVVAAGFFGLYKLLGTFRNR